MDKVKLKDLLYLIGGNTKIIIFNIANNSYKELFKGIVDDIDFKNIEFGEKEVEHLTVVNGEDYLQIHITV